MGVAIGSTQSFVISFQPLTFLSFVFFMALSSRLSFQDDLLYRSRVSGPSVRRTTQPSLAGGFFYMPGHLPEQVFLRVELDPFGENHCHGSFPFLFFFDARIKERPQDNNRGVSDLSYGAGRDVREDDRCGMHRRCLVKGAGKPRRCRIGLCPMGRLFPVSRRFAGCP